MTEETRGIDRAGLRAKRFLIPLQKYEIFLQLVRQDVTVIEAADQWQIDRGVIIRIRTVAKEGALGVLSKSRLARREKERDMELLAARADSAHLGDALKEMACQLMLDEGKEDWGELAASHAGWTRTGRPLSSSSSLGAPPRDGTSP